MIQKNSQGLFETEIDGKTYHFSQWGTRRSLDGLLQLSDICGEFLAKAAAAWSKKGALQQEVSTDAISEVVNALLKGVNKDKTTTLNLIERLVTERAQCDGVDIDFNRHFDGNLLHLFKVLKAALEVQYGSFFAEALGARILTTKS